ncbi:TRAP transporter substrate-binding protein [Halopelagius longus]|uniref:TRAP transporter substrate-binding protein n=1 Tax=Halopelagius longus TaxID=1236180 RepID=A0A1H1FDR4_9EURY|nr:TRAP transporter substrate-binding protein [Halopelagius longus]RDI70154.1 TRAP transporter substrate-binding protein [Halopelagius longus]SDQ98978.1 TRAP-type C4-dicarboxylate transport system, substrate-binding protein [Halopelagius longus]
MSQQSRRSFIKRASLLGGTGAVTSLAGCSGAGGGSGNTGTTGSSGGGDSGSESHSMLIGSVFPSGHVINEMANSWADTVAKETDDRVSITIEPAFGGEQEVMEQTRIGSIDGTIIGTRWVIDYDPKNFWVESPFVFENWEQQKRAFEADYLDDGKKRLREEGNQRLVEQPVYRGYRHTSGKSAFETPEDIQGTNLRVPDLSPWVNIWEGIGASPTTVAFDELYSALQQGVVKAQENPAETVLSASLHEVQSHYTLTQHLASTGWFTLNTDTFSSLSDDDQTVVTDTLTQSIKDLSTKIAESESKAIDELKNKGMTIVEPDRDAWLAAAEEPLKAQFEKKWEPSLEEVRNI